MGQTLKDILMKEIEVNTKMIAACGFYCGACRKS
jgi:hypothetical protein